MVGEQTVGAAVGLLGDRLHLLVAGATQRLGDVVVVGGTWLRPRHQLQGSPHEVDEEAHEDDRQPQLREVLEVVLADA